MRTESVLLLMGAAIVGWLLGGASAWLARSLLAADDEPLPPTAGPLAPDPVLQGMTALAFVVVAWVLGASVRSAAVALAALPLVHVSMVDLRYRVVYALPAVVASVVGMLLIGPLAVRGTWDGPGLLAASLGAIGGFLVFLLIWWAGRLLYGMEALARGDVYIAALVGAFAGAQTPRALVTGIVLSGLYALGTLVVRRSRAAFIPYGPGLCLGGFIALLTGP